MSWANNASGIVARAPASALPPYLTTTTWPAKRRMYGSASTSDVGPRSPVDGHALLVVGRRFGLIGYRPTAGSPAVSGRPSATLAACTAPPLAPLAEVVDRADRDDRVGALVVAGRECAALVPSVALVDGEAGRTTTNGSPRYRPASVASNDDVVTPCRSAWRSTWRADPRFSGARCGVNSTWSARRSPARSRACGDDRAGRRPARLRRPCRTSTRASAPVPRR